METYSLVCYERPSLFAREICVTKYLITERGNASWNYDSIIFCDYSFYIYLLFHDRHVFNSLQNHDRERKPPLPPRNRDMTKPVSRKALAENSNRDKV